MTIQPLLKPQKNAEDDPYLTYIRLQPSLVTGQRGDIDAHHVVPAGQGKVGGKVSNRCCVPLTRILHQEYHQHGRTAFEEKYGIDFDNEIDRLNRGYRPPAKKRSKEKPSLIKKVLVFCARCNRDHRLPPSLLRWAESSFVCPISGDVMKASVRRTA